MLGTLVVVTLVLCGVGAVFTADAATVVTGGDVAALSDMVGIVLVFEFACTVFNGVVIIDVVDFDGSA